jgi:hypothetical protein
MIIKCHFQSCKNEVEAPDDDSALEAGPTATVLASGILLGHQQYRPVPSALRKVSGRPWLCPYHEVMLEATLALTTIEERQRQELVAQLRTGKMVKDECGWYAQVPPKPVTPYTVKEDNGDIRTSTVVWFTPEQAIAKMNGEPQSTAYRPEASDAE